jgi:hypothetical protein
MVKRIILVSSFLITSIFLQGCLLFNTVSYEVKLETETTGTVTVIVEDIKSNAADSKTLNEDKDILFRFLHNSEDFIYQMEGEGKNIYLREYFVEGEKLNGKIEYSFDDITKVEGIVYDEPFYYLTLALDDSVVSTNGEIVHSEGHKRIIWDNSINTLKFSMFGEETSGKKLVGMAQYYKK